MTRQRRPFSDDGRPGTVLAHPDLVPEAFQRFFHRWVGPSLRACDRVVTTSEFDEAADIEGGD